MPGLLINTGSGAIGISGSPPAPVGLVNAEATGTTTVQVSWTDDAAPEAPSRTFLVERSTDGENWTEIGTPTASPLNDTGRTAGTLYHYRVTARNFWGSAVPLSDTVTTESEGAPDAPSGLAATALGSSSIGLTWTDNSDNETNFELQRATENTFASPTTIEPAANATGATDSGLTEETEYFYRIRATNGTGDSSWSSTASATTASAGAAPEFSLTAVPDADVGITATIVPLFGTKWMWQVRTVDFRDNDLPSIAVVTHQLHGGAIYDRGSGWSYTNATADYGIASITDIKSATGGFCFADWNFDGTIDLGHFGETGSDPSFYYDDGDESLASGNSLRLPLLSALYEREDGYLEHQYEAWDQWPEAIEWTRRTAVWGGSSWSTSDATVTLPSGIESSTLAEMESALDDGSHNTNFRYMLFDYTYYDLTGSGVADDLIIQLIRAYSNQPSRTWLLTSDGDGTFTDRTTEWGLPTSGGVALIPGQFGHFRPFLNNPGWQDASWADLAGTGRPDLFLSTNSTGGGYHGHYRWNGSGYTRLTSSPITARLALNDSYPKRLYVCDLTNSGHLDVILQISRTGYTYIFINDGAGNLTEYAVYRHWDADGMDCIDLDGDYLPDFVIGGDGGVDSGVTSSATARCLSIRENTTTNPGNAIAFKLRRTGHPNKFGVGARIDVHTAGQSFSAASLIRRWYARPDGQKLVFGVGNAATVDYRVTWPDDTTTSATGVSVNQTVTVTGD